MIAKAAEVFGRVDMLVNNAGIYPHHDLLTVGEAEWDDMHQSNLRGAFFCAQAAANQMIRQGTGGAIVNILSINAFRPMADGLVYGSSKAGLEMVTRCMAFELGKYGIRVNAVAPGLSTRPASTRTSPAGGNATAAGPLSGGSRSTSTSPTSASSAAASSPHG